MNPLILVYFGTHVAFAIFLGQFFALAPDEGGYLYTFNNLYNSSQDHNPQLSSGWITAPKAFLWVSYLPVSFLTLVGVPDYLAIRLLSIALGTLNLYLLKEILQNSSYHKLLSQRVAYVFFFIPSIFVWTSLGLRESFILAQCALILCGANFLIQKNDKRGLLFLLLGSYGLISTKNYLWLCLIIAMFLSCIIFAVRGGSRSTILKLLIAGFLLPLTMFLSTTSIYALNFIFKSNISTIGERTSQSVSTFSKDSLGGGGTNSGGTNSGGTNSGGTNSGGTNSGGSSETNEKLPETFTIYGDATLISLYFYLIDNPNSPITRVLKFFNFDEKIKSRWNEMVAISLGENGNPVDSDLSDYESQTLVPAEISKPMTLIPAGLMFLFGPIPTIEEQGIVSKVASLESPFWWVLYVLVILQFLRFRKEKFLDDLPILLSSIFVIGMVAMSALVEVNLGTSFRHRSILFTPLIFIYFRLPQLASINRGRSQ